MDAELTPVVPRLEQAFDVSITWESPIVVPASTRGVSYGQIDAAGGELRGRIDARLRLGGGEVRQFRDGGYDYESKLFFELDDGTVLYLTETGIARTSPDGEHREGAATIEVGDGPLAEFAQVILVGVGHTIGDTTRTRFSVVA